MPRTGLITHPPKIDRAAEAHRPSAAWIKAITTKGTKLHEGHLWIFFMYLAALRG